MKKQTRNALAALLAGSLLLSSCASGSGTESSMTAEPVKAERHIVFLGDSITAGYGLEDPTLQAYSVLLTEKLNAGSDDTVWSEYNYALSGDDSTDLLERLQAGRAVRLPSAERIVICIGANNMLGAYTDYLKELVGDRDVSDMTEEQLEQLQKDITDQVQNDRNAQAKLEEKIDSGLERLKTDLEEIYTWIREKNADGEIYVLNIYNPYRGVTETLPNTEEPLGEFAQREIDRCNAILADWASAHADLHFTDLAAAFTAENPVPILGASDAENAEGMYLDPHPNVHGHEIIADLLCENMK